MHFDVTPKAWSQKVLVFMFTGPLRPQKVCIFTWLCKDLPLPLPLLLPLPLPLPPSTHFVFFTRLGLFTHSVFFST
jgi:hypothetical protein